MSESLGSSLKPEIDCWIEVDEKPLPKYREMTTESEGSIVVSCWIASEPGKTFSIDWDEKNIQCHTIVIINGVLVHSCASPAGQSSGRWRVDDTNDGKTRKKFEFATIIMTETTSEHGASRAAMPEFGTINVNYYRITDVVESESRYKQKAYNVEGLAQFHEQQKLVGFNCVSLRDAGPVVDICEKKYKYTRIDKDKDKPWRSFIFKYKPLDYLRAEGIAPLPDNLESACDEENKNDLLLGSAIKIEYKEDWFLETLHQRQKNWEKYEKDCRDHDEEVEKRYKEHEEKVRKEASELEARLQKEHRAGQEKERKEREKKAKMVRKMRDKREREKEEKERREREEEEIRKEEEESRERERQYTREKWERELTFLREKREREEKHEKGRQEREERLLREKKEYEWEQLEREFAGVKA